MFDRSSSALNNLNLYEQINAFLSRVLKLLKNDELMEKKLSIFIFSLFTNFACLG